MAVRDLGFLAWRDDLSWLEKQKCGRWEAAVRSENQRFIRALKKVKQIQPTVKPIRPSTVKNGWKVYDEEFRPLQTWTNGKLSLTNVSSADIHEDLLAVSLQDSDGYERFTLKIYRDSVEIFALPNVGPTVFFSGTHLIFLGSSKDLRYDSVMSLSLHTYTATTLYTLEDPFLNLELNLAEDGSVYVTEGDFVDLRFGFVEDGSLKWYPKKVSSVFVVDRETQILNGGKGIEAASRKGSWTIRRSHGIQILKHKGHSVTVWGEITFDPRDPMQLHIADIRYEPYTIRISDNSSASLQSKNPKAYPYSTTYTNEIAPTFIVHPSKKPRGLLVTAYGAYGIPTKIGNLVSRWRGLLDRGWIVASVAVPGGGDHDDAWKKAGQRLNRLHSIEVFTEAIRGLQQKFSIGPDATALYGRSAGGQLVAATAVNTPRLVGAIYVESPYLDALRTISNPKLPLTAIETREFGDRSPVDILATAAWSPMEHIPSGQDRLLVIARSDYTDLQVPPYEPMKWSMRLRSAGHEALLYIHKGRGHFTTTAETRAEDLSLLDGWLDSQDPRNKNLSYKYKMPKSVQVKKDSQKNKSGGRRKMTMRKSKMSKKSRSTRKGGARRH